ncbi:hypothetical protein [Rubritalea tangerina]|uniref:Uncharacterized protein n=1 Tax=Rubritalea tangerina TaxID=430798 RepID=A0ABW4ZF33_9BACT
MVVLKSHKAFGSFLGRGTHVWLEIVREGGEKVTFSGAKVRRMLAVVENLKRDYDKESTRGAVVIPAPEGMGDAEWDALVIEAGRSVKASVDRRYRYSGLLHCLPDRGNCCTVVNLIIERAGGRIPRFRPQGVAPGLSVC